MSEMCYTGGRASVICRVANQACGVAGSYARLSYGNVLGTYGLDPSNSYPYVFVAGLNKARAFLSVVPKFQYPTLDVNASR